MVDEAWVSELERRAAPLRVALPPWGEVLARETWHVPPAERGVASNRWVTAAIGFVAAAGLGLVWWDRSEVPVPSVIAVDDEEIAEAPTVAAVAPAPVPTLVIELGPPPPSSPPSVAPRKQPLPKPSKGPKSQRKRPAPELTVDCILDPRLCKPARARVKGPPRSADPQPSGPTLDCILDPALCPKPPKPATDLPDTIGTTEIKAGMGAIIGNVKECGEIHGIEAGTRVIVKLSVSGATGRVTQALIQSPQPVDPAFASCVVAAVRRAEFPRFLKSALGVVYPFTL